MWFTFDQGLPNEPKKKKNSKLKIHFNQNYKPKNISYHDALFRNASLIKDIYNGPFDVLLSGGIDSEVVVRTFNHLGIKQNVYTFRFEDNINVLDVQNAISTCKDLNIKLNIVDFNLKKFFENDAEQLYKTCYPAVVEKLVRYRWFDYLDNIPVAGDGEPYWVRDEWNNFKKKSNWSMVMVEHDYAHSIYSKYINRTIIGEWYMFTPEIWLSYLEIDYIKNLINDEIPNKLSSWSFRDQLHRPLWPSIKTKQKLVGYEGINRYASLPDYMEKFKTEVMNYKEIEFRYTVDKLHKLFDSRYNIVLEDKPYFKKLEKLKIKWAKNYETN